MPIKQSDFDALYKQLTNLVPAVLDLLKQLGKYIALSLQVLERHNRAFEELGEISNRIDAFQEMQRENTFEISRWATQLNKDINRLEEYIILVGMGKGESHQAQAITQVVSQEHIERGLREELVAQQKLLMTYSRNLTKVQQQIAEMGYTSIENGNKEDEYQHKIDRATEAIARIREALNG